MPLKHSIITDNARKGPPSKGRGGPTQEILAMPFPQSKNVGRLYQPPRIQVSSAFCVATGTLLDMLHDCLVRLLFTRNAFVPYAVKCIEGPVNQESNGTQLINVMEAPRAECPNVKAEFWGITDM